MHCQSLDPGPPPRNDRAQKVPSPSICLLVCLHPPPPPPTRALLVTTQPNKRAFFHCLFCPFSVEGEASSPKRERWDHPLTRHKWQRPPRFLPAGRLQCPGIAASSLGHGALAAEASSVQTAAASGWKRWHLPTPFLYPPQPSPVLPPPTRRRGAP